VGGKWTPVANQRAGDPERLGELQAQAADESNVLLGPDGKLSGGAAPN
jgi:hypothetical protein